MGICEFERKWWHARLEIEDQNNSVQSTHTTVDPADAGAIADSTITVRVDNASCAVQTDAADGRGGTSQSDAKADDIRSFSLAISPMPISPENIPFSVSRSTFCAM